MALSSSPVPTPWGCFWIVLLYLYDFFLVFHVYTVIYHCIQVYTLYTVIYQNIPYINNVDIHQNINLLMTSLLLLVVVFSLVPTLPMSWNNSSARCTPTDAATLSTPRSTHFSLLVPKPLARSILSTRFKLRMFFFFLWYSNASSSLPPDAHGRAQICQVWHSSQRDWLHWAITATPPHQYYSWIHFRQPVTVSLIPL